MKDRTKNIIFKFMDFLSSKNPKVDSEVTRRDAKEESSNEIEESNIETSI